MSLNAYFENVTQDSIKSDLTALLPPGTALKNYILATSLPSQGKYFLLGPLGAFNLHFFSIGVTDHNDLIIYDRISKQSNVLTPQTVAWVTSKKNWISDTLIIALPNQTRLGLMIPHHRASLPDQAQNLESIRSALALFPQKQIVRVPMIYWFKVIGFSFLLSCFSLIPLIITRYFSQSNPLFGGLMLLTILAVLVITIRRFKYFPKITGALAGTGYGVFFGLMITLAAQSFTNALFLIPTMSVVGLLFGYAFGFIYGLVSKQDQYQDFSG